jgi:hypothetical protein
MSPIQSTFWGLSTAAADAVAAAGRLLVLLRCVLLRVVLLG